MRKAFSILILFMIAASALNTGGCVRSKSKAARASRELAEAITRSSLQSDTADQVVAAEETRVFIDSTVSMSGFAGKGSDFDRLIETIGNYLPNCITYRYGLEREAMSQHFYDFARPVSLGRELLEPHFYNLGFNPDDRLIEELVRIDHPVFSVLITDGVYSEPRAGYPPVVIDAIKKWIEKGRVFGILIFKSRFDGKFYSERTRSIISHVAVDDRPFYIFVFSPTVEEFKNLREKLQRRFQKMTSLLFSDEAIETSIVLPERVEGMYSVRKPPETSYYWQMFDTSLFSSKNPAEIGFNIRYKIDPNYPVVELRPTFSPKCYHWEGHKFGESETNLPQGFSVKPSDIDPSDTPVAALGQASAEDNRRTSEPLSTSIVSSFSDTPDFIAYLPKAASGDYSFYNIGLILAIKALRPDIEALSTHDDSNVRNANKTFRFHEFVESLSNIHFRSRLAAKASPALFLTITNH